MALSALVVAAAVAAIAHAPSPRPQLRPASQSDERAAFVTTLGRDTVAMERFTRTATRVVGDVIVRAPGTVLCHYTIELRPDGTPARTVVDVQPLGTTEVPRQHVALEFDGNAVRVTSEIGGKRQTTSRTVPAGTMPFFMTGFGAAYGLYTAIGPMEAYLAHANAPVGDTIAVPSIDIATAQTATRRFVRRSPTQADADWFGVVWMHLTQNAAGEITAVDATGTTEKTLTQRSADFDASEVAGAFARLDRAGHGLGAVSPNTIARGTVHGRLVVVTYGSPATRGRTILGNVVPYGRVWRTGANDATVLVSDRDLDVGGTTLPAGAYSLWTLPASDGTVTLIINRQHGQWGTEYDASQDVARVPMRVTTAATPRERFTIEIVDGDSPQLRMNWDTFVWSVPLR